MEWIKSIKTVELLWTIFVIKLNVNGINIQIKKQRLSNCTKKKAKLYTIYKIWTLNTKTQ